MSLAGTKEVFTKFEEMIKSCFVFILLAKKSLLCLKVIIVIVLFCEDSGSKISFTNIQSVSDKVVLCTAKTLQLPFQSLKKRGRRNIPVLCLHYVTQIGPREKTR